MLWCPSSLLFNEYRGVVLRVERPGREVDLSYMPLWRRPGTASSLTFSNILWCTWKYSNSSFPDNFFFRAEFCVHCPCTPCATCLASLTRGLTNRNVHEVHIFWSSLLCIFTPAFCYFLGDPDIFLHYLFFSEYKRPSLSPIQNYFKDLSTHLSQVRGISFFTERRKSYYVTAVLKDHRRTQNVSLGRGGVLIYRLYILCHKRSYENHVKSLSLHSVRLQGKLN